MSYFFIDLSYNVEERDIITIDLSENKLSMQCQNKTFLYILDSQTQSQTTVPPLIYENIGFNSTDDNPVINVTKSTRSYSLAPVYFNYISNLAFYFERFTVMIKANPTPDNSKFHVYATIIDNNIGLLFRFLNFGNNGIDQLGYIRFKLFDDSMNSITDLEISDVSYNSSGDVSCNIVSYESSNILYTYGSGSVDSGLSIDYISIKSNVSYNDKIGRMTLIIDPSYCHFINPDMKLTIDDMFSNNMDFSFNSL